MDSSERGETGHNQSREAHRERAHREFQRVTPAGVHEPVLILFPEGCEDPDRGVADLLQRAPSAHVPGQSDTGAIRGGLAAIPDREGGNFLNLRVDQGWVSCKQRGF